MGAERRLHKRYCVKGLKAQLRESRFFGLLSKPTSIEYPCIDISEGGLQFVTKKPFKRNTKLLLDIHNSFSRDNPIRAKSKVVWLKSLTMLSTCLVGVEFRPLKKSEHNELKKIMAMVGEDKEKISSNIKINLIKDLSAAI
jgi:hypothetical protein